MPSFDQAVAKSSASSARDQNSFDSLRLIFASLVILSHSYALVRLGDPLEAIDESTYDLGKLGVTGFFAISGFLVTSSWLRTPSVAPFLTSRFLRIFPGYFVALVFSAIAAAIAAIAFDSPNVPTLSTMWTWVAKNAFFIWKTYDSLLPGAFETNPMSGGPNGSLWTLTFELHCYVAVLVLGVSGILRRPLLVLSVALVLVFFYWKLILGGGAAFRFQYHELYLAFATGMVLAACGRRYALAFLAVVIAGTLAAHHLQLPSHRWWYGPVQVGISLVLLAVATSPLLSRLRFPTGDYSYGLYIFAFPVQQTVIAALGAAATPMLIFTIAMPCIAALAFFSWHLVEQPSLALRRRIAYTEPVLAKR